MPAAAAEIAVMLPVVATEQRPLVRPASLRRDQEIPQFRWARIDGSDRWTMAMLTALATHGRALEQMVPSDIASWCPAYPENDAQQRRYFWGGLISALTKHESTYRPSVAGDGGKSIGLMQIRPGTARAYGCAARSSQALRAPGANLACAVRILAQTVPRDGVVSAGMRGAAADWGPFHQRRKREDMRAWMLQQPYCQKPVDLSAPRPRARDLSRFAERRPTPRPVQNAL